MIRRYARSESNSDVEKQLTIFKESLVDTMRLNSVEPFEYPPETLVDINVRKRISIIDSKGAEDGITRIEELVRPGYHYTPQQGSIVILRKAEVVTHTEPSPGKSSSLRPGVTAPMLTKD